MKRLTEPLWILLLAALCANSAAYAASTSDTVGVVITVDPKFTFAIGESTLDMGTVQEGNAGSGSVTMYCGTNHDLPWTILVKSSTIVSGSNQIPVSNFKFYTYGAADEKGIGTFVGTATALTTADQPAYTAAASEKSDTDVRVVMGVALDVPWGTPSGTYNATVTATMTE